jgi:hypothetical protein
MSLCHSPNVTNQLAASKGRSLAKYARKLSTAHPTVRARIGSERRTGTRASAQRATLKENEEIMMAKLGLEGKAMFLKNMHATSAWMQTMP